MPNASGVKAIGDDFVSLRAARDEHRYDRGSDNVTIG
jgi:hypothetical protein